MPILHKYVDQSGYYVKTNIKGNLVTFQLTKEGLSRLLQAGCDDKRKFPIQILLDLVRDGDAYTEGSGVSSVSDPKQMQFDFAPVPEIENLFPQCSKCASYDDLRLVLMNPTQDHAAQILCESCVLNLNAGTLANIPLSILTSKSLETLTAQGKISGGNECFKLLKKWFAAEISRFWEEYSIQKKDRQGAFDFPGQGNLF